MSMQKDIKVCWIEGIVVSPLHSDTTEFPLVSQLQDGAELDPHWNIE